MHIGNIFRRVLEEIVDYKKLFSLINLGYFFLITIGNGSYIKKIEF